MTEHTQNAATETKPNVVGVDVIEAEITRFAEGMDLDLNPKGLDDEDKASLEDALRRVRRAMAAGRLVIDAECQPVFTPTDGKKIVFYEPTGASLMAADQKKKGHDMAKTYAAIGDMTQENPSRFAALPGRDVKVCTALFALFMAG